MECSSFLSAYCITYKQQKVEEGHAIASLLVDFLVEDVPYEYSNEEQSLVIDQVLPITSGSEDKPPKICVIYMGESHGKYGSNVG